MSESDPLSDLLADHERAQLDDYMEMVLADPESICHSFSPDRRAEFFRLVAKVLVGDDRSST